MTSILPVSFLVLSGFIAIHDVEALSSIRKMGKKLQSDAILAGISPYGELARHEEKPEAHAETKGERPHGHILPRSEAHAETKGEDVFEAAPSIGVAVQSGVTEKQNQVSEPKSTKMDENQWSNLLAAFLNLVELAIALVFAYLYKTKVVDLCPVMPAAGNASKGKDFSKGLFECFSDMDMCLHSCCCTSCRAAHTWQVTQLLDYWKGIFLFSCCCLCMPCISGCYMRQKLRGHIGLEEDSCIDFVRYCFCNPCSVAQEAMMVDEETGVRVQCCLKMTKSDAPLLANNEKASSRSRSAQNKAKTSDSNEAEVDF